jgi:hypothetical protein
MPFFHSVSGSFQGGYPHGIVMRFPIQVDTGGSGAFLAGSCSSEIIL